MFVNPVYLLRIRLLRYILLLLLVLINLQAKAQSSVLTIDEVIERITNTEEESEVLRNELIFLSQHPINLNRLTRKQLEQIPFLRDDQIDQMVDYLFKHKSFETLYELQLVNGMDAITIQNLLPFIFIGPIEVSSLNFQQLISKAEQQFFLRGTTCLQEKKGFSQDTSSSPGLNSRYLGDTYAHSFRYRLTSNDQLQIGIIGDKDAGEPFLGSKYNKSGYDYYSFHVGLSNVGFLQRLVVGDYKLSFGQGLLINNGFSLCKNTSGSNTGYSNQGIRFHYSSSESDFLRGVATTLKFGGGEYSFFYSDRTLDAIGDSVITSFKEDGIHRTTSDFSKKNILPMALYGGHVNYNLYGLEVGFTALSYHFEKEIYPKPNDYNLYYFRGRDNFDIGMDYRLHIGKLHFFGELAQSRNGAKASIISVQSPVTSDFQLLASYRNYAKDYQAYYANPFKESASFNERGFLLSATYQPLYTFKLSLYADWFAYPWLKFGVDSPSSGSDYRATIDYLPSERWSNRLDIRFRQKEKNGLESQVLQDYSTTNLIYQSIYDFSPSWKLKTLFAYNRYKEEFAPSSSGCLFSESLVWNSTDELIRVEACGSIFNTDDYDSRVWLYENSGLYASSSTSLYGKGCRLSSSIRYKIRESLTLWIRYAQTTYSNRELIGSALEQIKGNNKSDLSFYIQWLF